MIDFKTNSGVLPVKKEDVVAIYPCIEQATDWCVALKSSLSKEKCRVLLKGGREYVINHPVNEARRMYQYG